MKAVVITRFGGPEVLSVRDVPDPVAGPGEVLISVAAAGLNRADVQQRRGFYAPPPGASEIPGLEVSGLVAARGDGVKGFSVGQPVCALLAGGGYAEQVAVPAGQVLPVPSGVDLVTAAALPEVAATVYANLYQTAGVKAGEWVLVHGGAGGIGTMASQLLAATGARVIVTASSEQKLDFCRRHGAEAGINYRTEDFVERVGRITGGHGADVVLDVVGAKYLRRNVEALATGGRLIVIGLQGGTTGELDLARLMTKRALIAGTTLRARPAAEKAAVMSEVGRVVWPLVEQRTVRPVLDRTFALADAVRAHEYFDSGEHQGKILLTV